MLTESLTRAVNDLVVLAGGLEAIEVERLAKATDRMVSLRQRRSWTAAHKAVVQIAESAGRETDLNAAVEAVEGAVLRSVMTVASLQEDATVDLASSFAELGEGLARPELSDRERQSIGKEVEKLARRRLGRTLEHRLFSAGVGSVAAVSTLVTWDLTASTGPLTLSMRDTLLTPWLVIKKLPVIVT